jgi:acyl-CoA synthetase (AMP-forming)/AMP-acid ligase II
MSFRTEDLDQHRTLVDRLCFLAQEGASERGYLFLADGEAEEHTLSLGELDRRSRALAARLQRLDAARALCSSTRPLSSRWLLRLPYAGVVAVPTYYPRLNALDPG